MFYPTEEKLVSLDVLKLYRGEDIVWPEKVDPNRWLDKGELTKLPELPREEAEEGVRE